MSAVNLPLAQRPGVYEDALDSALEAMRNSYDVSGEDQALIEELRNAFRVAPPAQAAA